MHEVLHTPGQPLNTEAQSFAEPRFGHDFSQVPVRSGLSGVIQAKPIIGQPGYLLEREADRPPASGQQMPSVKKGLEQLSSTDLSGVRVHYNSSKPAQLNALAYTQGQDIHICPGQEEHLPREGWHVVQQIQGHVKPTIQVRGVSINDAEELEREADVMGARVLQTKGAEPNQD